MFKYSTGFRNAVLDTGSIKSTFDGNGSSIKGYIKIYAAPTAVPATADASLGDAVPLVTISDNSGTGGLNLAAAASSGSISKLGTQTWSGAAGATNTAAFFRYVQTGDTGGNSTTEKRIQGTVGVAASGADMILSNVSIASGTTYTIDYFSLTFLDV